MLSGNVFTQSITFTATDTTPQDVATITVNPGATVGGQVTWALTIPIDDSSAEASAGLLVFSVARTPDGTLDGAVSSPVIAEGGTVSTGTPTFSVDTSGDQPIIQVALADSAGTEDATFGFAVNYYGGTWGGGIFPNAT